jgi:hypothetical protein
MFLIELEEMTIAVSVKKVVDKQEVLRVQYRGEGVTRNWNGKIGGRWSLKNLHETEGGLICFLLLLFLLLFLLILFIGQQQSSKKVVWKTDQSTN